MGEDVSAHRKGFALEDLRSIVEKHPEVFVQVDLDKRHRWNHVATILASQSDLYRLADREEDKDSEDNADADADTHEDPEDNIEDKEDGSHEQAAIQAKCRPVGSKRKAAPDDLGGRSAHSPNIETSHSSQAKALGYCFQCEPPHRLGQLTYFS